MSTSALCSTTGSRWLAGFASLWLCVACARPQVTYPLPEIPVRITRWPERPLVDCYLADLVPELEAQPWPEGVKDDALHRYHVSKRDFDDLVRHVADLRALIETLRTCLDRTMRQGK